MEQQIKEMEKQLRIPAIEPNTADPPPPGMDTLSSPSPVPNQQQERVKKRSSR